MKKIAKILLGVSLFVLTGCSGAKTYSTKEVDLVYEPTRIEVSEDGLKTTSTVNWEFGEENEKSMKKFKFRINEKKEEITFIYPDNQGSIDYTYKLDYKSSQNIYFYNIYDQYGAKEEKITYAFEPNTDTRVIFLREDSGQFYVSLVLE